MSQTRSPGFNPGSPLGPTLCNKLNAILFDRPSSLPAKHKENLNINSNTQLLVTCGHSYQNDELQAQKESFQII